MAKRKVDVKSREKTRIMGIVGAALRTNGIRYTSGDSYGMSEGTLVAHTNTLDVQIRPITPRANTLRYQQIVEPEAEAEAPQEIVEVDLAEEEIDMLEEEEEEVEVDPV